MSKGGSKRTLFLVNGSVSYCSLAEKKHLFQFGEAVIYKNIYNDFGSDWYWEEEGNFC